MHAVLVLGLLGMALVQLKDEPLTIRIAPSVSVGTERLRLDAIAELRGGEAQQRQALGAIELGASPLPGQKRKFTRAQLLTRLRQHGYPPEALRIEMPGTIEITRVAQSLGTESVDQFARAEIQKRTGIDIAQWRLENPPAESALPEGEIVLSVVGAPRISERTASIEIVAWSTAALRRAMPCDSWRPSGHDKLWCVQGTPFKWWFRRMGSLWR